MVDKKKVNKPELQIRDYWRHYRRTARVTTIMMQIVVTLIVGLSLIAGGLSVDSLLFWMTITATLATSTMLNFFMIEFILAPLRDLSMAITNASGQKPTDPLANPNAPRYTQNGFRPLLQFVYENTRNESVEESTANSPAQKQLDAALRQTNAGIVILDSLGRVQYANKSAPVNRSKPNEPSLELLFDPATDFEDWLKDCRQNAVHAEKSWERVPDKIVGEEGRRVFNISANYEKGSVAEVVIATYDSTDIYQPEDDELDFISFAAHELRGPITVIRGYLDVLEMELNDKLEPEHHELFKRLVVSANRLSGYINNILNTSKYDRRHLNVKLQEDTLSHIYDSVKDDMELRAQSQHRLLAVNIPKDLPTVAADKSSISEVMSNLIDNALKYSNEGGAVSVSAEIEGDFVKVSIKDNGIGIPTNVIGNLFHKFYRSHRSRETVAGTGIGLYICKAIIESHGGKIGVSSIEGEGSVFSFTVPIYSTVQAKLQANDHSNAGLISTNEGWIKNHSKYVD